VIIKYTKLDPEAQVPRRVSDGAVGYDLFALRAVHSSHRKVRPELPIKIRPGETVLVGTGIVMVIPWFYRGEIVPRSGLALKYGIDVANSPGTIDPDYRGEICVLLVNRGKKVFTIEKGMRIAQLLFTKIEVPVLKLGRREISDSRTKRGAGGFGHTGSFGRGLGTDLYDEAFRRMDRYYMKVVSAIAERSTCMRGVRRLARGRYAKDKAGNFIGQTRRFGCVIVKDDNIIAQGFNDQYPGAQKCALVGCLREQQHIPSGSRIEDCRAMHAEWWAITNAAKSGNSSSMKGATMYVNAAPCKVCAKIIAGTGIDTVVILRGAYPNNGLSILREAGINVRYVKL